MAEKWFTEVGEDGVTRHYDTSKAQREFHASEEELLFTLVNMAPTQELGEAMIREISARWGDDEFTMTMRHALESKFVNNRPLTLEEGMSAMYWRKEYVTDPPVWWLYLPSVIAMHKWKEEGFPGDDISINF